MYGSSPIEMLALDASLKGCISCQGFTYSALWFGATALGANGTVNVTTQITADSDFIIQRMNLVSYTAADTPEVNPDFTVLLTLAGSGRNLMDQAQHVNNVCGNFFDNRVPNDLTFPILVQANNNIVAQLVNRSAVAQNYTLLSYVGFKVYYLQNPDGTTATRQQVFRVL